MIRTIKFTVRWFRKYKWRDHVFARFIGFFTIAWICLFVIGEIARWYYFDVWDAAIIVVPFAIGVWAIRHLLNLMFGDNN